MARLATSLVVLLTVITYVAAKVDSELQVKISIINREATIAADAVRAITVNTTQGKVLLYTIATDFITALNLGTYAINNVVPHLNSTEGSKLLASSALKLDNLVNDLQTTMLTGDTENIKKKLSMGLEYMKNEVLKYEDRFKLLNRFVDVQFKREFDFIIYAIYKAKYQALYFDKKNKDLEPDLKELITYVTDALNSLPPNIDKNVADEEIRHALGHVSVVTERCAYKLQNWLEVNSNSAEGLKMIEDFAVIIAEHFDKANKAASKLDRADVMKFKLLHAYRTGVEFSIQAGKINYPDNTGGTEFIRSCIFDALTVGRAYGENIKAILTRA